MACMLTFTGASRRGSERVNGAANSVEIRVVTGCPGSDASLVSATAAPSLAPSPHRSPSPSEGMLSKPSQRATVPESTKGFLRVGGPLRRSGKHPPQTPATVSGNRRGGVLATATAGEGVLKSLNRRSLRRFLRNRRRVIHRTEAHPPESLPLPPVGCRRRYSSCLWGHQGRYPRLACRDQ